MTVSNDPELVRLAVSLTELTYNGFYESRKTWKRDIPPDLQLALSDPRQVFDLMLTHLSKTDK